MFLQGNYMLGGALWDKIVDGIMGFLNTVIFNPLKIVLENLLMPLVEKFLEIIIYPVLYMFIGFFAKLIIPIILAVVLDFLSTPILNAYISVLGLIRVSSDILTIELVDTALNTTITIAASILLLITLWALIKSYFAYFGFETEEPWKIAVRLAVAGFFIYGSKSLFSFILSINSFVLDAVWHAIDQSGTGSFLNQDFTSIIDSFKTAMLPTFANILSSLLAPSGGNAGEQINNIASSTFTAGIDVILYLYILIRLLMLLFRFGERYVYSILLIVFGPLGIACAASPSTRNYFLGWSKTFFGNLIVQNMQIALIALVFKIPGSLSTAFTSGNWMIIKYILVIGAISALDKIEEFLGSIHISTGAGPSGPNAGFNNIASYAKSAMKFMK